MPKATFETKKITTETLGEYLAEIRRSLNLSGQDIQRLTRIPPKYLQALEQGDYDRLPSDVYVKGFLKSLAAVYHIPATSLLQQFTKERRLTERFRPAPSTTLAARFVPSWFMITPKTLTIVAVVLGILVSTGYLLWQIRSITAPPELVVAYPAEDVTVPVRNLLVRGRAEPGSRVLMNGQEISVEGNGEFREVINLINDTNYLLIRAENKFGKSTEVLRTVVVSAPSVAGSSAQSAPTPGPINVSIRIVGQDTWVRVTADGKTLQDGVVSAGAELQFQADEELVLSSGNAGATRLIYNGLDVGVLGREGDVVSNIRFTAL